MKNKSNVLSDSQIIESVMAEIDKADEALNSLSPENYLAKFNRVKAELEARHYLDVANKASFFAMNALHNKRISQASQLINLQITYLSKAEKLRKAIDAKPF